MAKQRSLHTKFWSDNWIRKMNPLDRYLFIYLITNEHTNLCGIYELPIETMAFESGIDVRELENSMLPRLSPKISYQDGWIFVMNFGKYHPEGSPKLQKGIEVAKSEVPQRIMDIFNEKLKGIDTLSPSASAFTSSPAFVAKERVSEIQEPERQYAVGIHEMILWAEQRKGHKFPDRPKQAGALGKILNSGFTPQRVRECWEELERDEYWGDKGFDFRAIVSEIGKAKGSHEVYSLVKKK